ncbi:hypothetical protein P7K49_035841 [Saguinus oedipus]|uniref:Uncharacterized protein n=1 Tax=Saguinus oedipus TaxID=9490 RepID=A0ABQ9TNS1_SAGOE|nr:hypothetical protein P7K49_035841 [Saguinus oedipus]
MDQWSKEIEVNRHPILVDADTTNHTVQTFTPTNTDLPTNYEMLKEEHEVHVLGVPHNPALPTSTVFTCSMKSRDRKMVGKLTGAQADASTTKCLNIWALISGIIMTVLLIIIPILILQVYQHIERNHPGQGPCP